MSLYDIDFPDLSNKLNVPKLRQSKFTAWMNALVAQLTWNHSRYFTDYAEGAVYSDYSNITTYTFGEIVLYRDSLNDKKGYLCIVDSSTGVAPTDTTNWLLIINDFIGANERLLWTPQKLVMEYILNKYFGTTFNQPPTPSDIYIVNTATTDMFPFWSEVNHPAWSNVTTYGLNATVKYNGRYWISLQAGNLAKIPDQQNTWWDSEPDIFTRYISTTAYTRSTIVRHSYFHYISLSATTGNAPPLIGGDNTWWHQLKNVWYYDASTAYNPGDVVDYNSNIYACILATTGNAPPNATYWELVVNPRIYTATDSVNAGYNIFIPSGLYSNLGGNTTHPNKADETIYRIVRKLWSATQFRIIRY